MIEIDEMLLFAALEDHSGSVHAYLDRQTGEILHLSEMWETQDEQSATYERLSAEPGRWVRIEPLPSRQAFRIMEDFVARVPPDQRQRTLRRALAWKKPFSNFRQAMYEMPELKKSWDNFHDDRLRRAANDWLTANAIDARLK